MYDRQIRQDIFMAKQIKKKIAFQGIVGAHSDVACRRIYPDLESVPYPSFEDVFEAVKLNKVDLGLIPIENSQVGRVAEIHNLLPEMHLFIVHEYFHRVHHFLLAPKSANTKSIRHVYSHPQALLQCRRNMHKMKIISHPYSDTAQAAKDIAEMDDPTKGAIASFLAAEVYGLKIIKKKVEDKNDNSTLFVTISKKPINPDPEKEKVLTSLVFIARNIPAALFKALGGFATNKINLLKLESYIPGKKKELAKFFVTFEGHPKERLVKLALQELQFFCENVTILGTYPADKSRFE
jgi:prephenate dehydratase